VVVTFLFKSSYVWDMTPRTSLTGLAGGGPGRLLRMIAGSVFGRIIARPDQKPLGRVASRGSEWRPAVVPAFLGLIQSPTTDGGPVPASAPADKVTDK